MTKVLFLTRSLNIGGAQRQLAELIRAIDKNQFDVTVATFYPDGPRWDDISAIPQVNLCSLNKVGRWDMVGLWRSSLDLATRTRPHVIYAFRDQGNLIALPLARAVGAMVVWGIRRSTKMLPVTKPIDLGMFALGAMLSHRVDRVVYNSECGRDLHLRRGYCEHNAVVIANGFDTQYFRPDWEVRRRKRATWGVDDEETLIGIIGRIDPVKDHHLFLQTAARIVSEYRTRFVVVGGGSDSYVKKLQQRAKRLGIEHRVLWVGETDEMVDIYNALDIVALCSKEEGFPNVIGEAMACGVPCIITDVGDAALMVGDTGLVVPPGNSEAMAAAWIKVLNLSADDRHRMGLAARERIAREYGIELMVARTSALLEGLVLSGGATRGERCR